MSEATRVQCLAAAPVAPPLAAQIRGSCTLPGPLATFTAGFPLASSASPVKGNPTGYPAQTRPQIAPEGHTDK